MALWPARKPPPEQGSRVRIVKPERRAITASATTVSRATAGSLRRLSQPWQIRALDYYDTVGECWYPAQFYARVLPKIRFYAGFRDEGGDIVEDEGALAELWARVHDPGSDGRDELTGSYGRLMFLTGDGRLVASNDEEGEEGWEFLSTLELRTKPETGGREEYLRIRAPGLTPEELVEAPDEVFEPVGNEARVWRFHRRHPAFSGWADSPVRAVLDLYELLKLQTLAAGSDAISRAASNGLFYWPDELFQPSPDSETGDEDPMADPLFQEIQEAQMSNIKDPGSAAAASPINIRGPGQVPNGIGAMIPVKELMGWMAFGPPSADWEAKWAQTIQRIENGLDGPDGLVTGTGDVNHWNGWLIDEQGYTQHVEPVASKFAADMVAAYLRPAARDAGIANWERAALGIDAAAAILHPDAAKTAKEGWLDGVLSAEAYREAIGATDEDAPSEDEQVFILALRGKGLPPELGGEGETAPQDGGTGSDVETGPPDTAPTPNGNRAAAQTAAATFKIIGAAESAVDRARTKAGARLVSRSKGCEPCKEKIQGVPLSLVASALGMEQVRGLVVTEAELVAGAGDELAETIRAWGVSGEWTGEIGKLVEQHAVRTVYETDRPPLPAGFAAVVSRALQAA